MKQDKGLKYEVEITTNKKGHLFVKPMLNILGKEARFEDYLILKQILQLEIGKLEDYANEIFYPKQDINTDKGIGIKSYTG